MFNLVLLCDPPKLLCDPPKWDVSPPENALDTPTLFDYSSATSVFTVISCGSYYIFLLRQFFLTIPSELSAAAKIDGASEFQIYWRIILPLARAALASVALFTFMANWNDFIGPLIYLSDKDQFTLAIGLYGFLSRVRTEWGPLMAASTIMISPVIILFFFTQRTFIQGITMTGIK